MAFEPSPWHSLPWNTEEPVELPAGAVHAAGVADVQVRNAARLAALGDLPAQQAHVQGVIVAALADVLLGMELERSQLLTSQHDIASVTLVAANRKLIAVGVMLLDLTLTLTLSPWERKPESTHSPLPLGEGPGVRASPNPEHQQ